MTIFLIIKPTRCTNFSNLFLEWNSTCFGQFLCPSSGVFPCTHSKPIWHKQLLCVQWKTGTSILADTGSFIVHCVGTYLPDGKVFCTKITYWCSLHKNLTFSQPQQHVVCKKRNINITMHCTDQLCSIKAHKTARQSSSSLYSNNMSENGAEVEEIVCKCFQVLRELRDPVPVPQSPVRKGGSFWPKWSEKATPWMWHLSERSSGEASRVTNGLKTNRYT